MKRFLALTVVLTAVTGLTQIAFAGSKEVVAPVPVEEPFSWTGFYLGGNLGANWSQYDFSKFEETADFDLFLRTRTLGDFDEGTQEFYGFNEGPFAPGRNAGSDGTPIEGGQIGFQYQFGHFVLGVED